jgi:hypothetical protein
MKIFRFSQNQKGNAILISLGVTSFMFVIAAGAGSLIDASLRQSPKIVNSGKAFYAAEGAVESALFEASGRSSGYETNVSPLIDQEHINKTQSYWTASSRQDLSRERTEGNPHDRTMYIPPRMVTDDTKNEDEIVNVTGNWKKVRFGQSYSFDLFVDNSDRFLGTDIGNSGSSIMFTKCETVPSMTVPTRCHVPHFIELEPSTWTNTTICDYTSGFDYVINKCTPPPPSTATGDDCSDPGELLGPNGICSSETTSVFEDKYGSINGDLIDIFFDVYVPAYKPNLAGDTAPILTWRLEGKTDPTTSTLPEVLELISTNVCDDTEIGLHPGSICSMHFDDPDPLITGVEQYHDGDKTWVRLRNPGGIIKGPNGLIRTSLMRFALKNMSDAVDTSNILNPLRLYFPRLTIQMGKNKSWDMDPSATKTQNISEAYVRIGFRYTNSIDPTTYDFSAFPVPSDKTTIQATGNADGFTQRINVEIQPQEIAPMFEYAVFQP